MDKEQNLNSESEHNRVWSLEEIRKHSVNWSLAGDIGLYNYLNDFSHYIICRTHEVQNALDTLVHETKMTSAKINNVINGFHMLSNTQFVENRVYDEEIQERVKEVPEPEKTKEQREAEMLPKIMKALELGLSVLDTAFDHIDVNEVSDSEDEDISSGGRTILEPKDPYEHRPLPYIIGSAEFLKCDYAGLKDLIEDEVQSYSEESISETDETTSEEGEPLPMDEEPPRPHDRISQDLSSSDESELFGSEKEENEPPLITKPIEQKNIQRKEPRSDSVSSIQSRLKLPQVLPIPKVQEKERDDLSTNDDNGDGDLFEEESPFRKKMGLFTSDTRFEDDEEDGDLFGNGLFGKAPKEKKEEKKEVKSSIPKGFVKTPLAAVVDQKKEATLFGNDEDSDDIFATLISGKKVETAKEKSVGSQDSSEKADTPSPPSSAPSTKPSGQMFDFDANEGSLFGDGDDLFSTKAPKKVFDFDATEKDDLFDIDWKSSKTAVANKSSAATVKKSELSLFGDDEDDFGDELFTQVKKPAQTSEKKSSPLFEELSKVLKTGSKAKTTEEKSDPLFDELSKTPKKEESKNLLFEQSGDFDLFAPKKTDIAQTAPSAEISKKDESKNLFFEESTDFDLFAPKGTTASSTEHPKKEESKNLLFEQSEDFDLFSPKETNIVQTEPAAEIPKKEEGKNLLFEKSTDFDLFVPKGTANAQAAPSAELNPVSSEDASSENLVGFDVPVDSSNILNVINKGRVKAPTKRRMPTRKGRLNALENPEKSEEDSAALNGVAAAEVVDTSGEKTAEPELPTLTHKQQEKKKMNLMSQLMNEVSESRVKKMTSPVAEVSGVDERDQTTSPFSLSSPKKSDVSSLFLDEDGANSKDVLDELINPASQDSKTNEQQKNLFPDLDDDDDDIFSSATNVGLPKVNENSSSLFNDDEDDDIFADLQKEKYEIFPSQIYEDEDDDIFANLDTSVKSLGVAANKTGSSLKKVETKEVDAFDDPLTGLLGQD